MRVLFTTWAWSSHLYPLVPLAWAFRAAGHDVRVASQPALQDTIAATGLTPVPVGRDIDFVGRAAAAAATGAPAPRPTGDEEACRLWRSIVGRTSELADVMAEDLYRAARHWGADLVVWDFMTFAGPIAARRLGVPSVRLILGPDHMTGWRADYLRTGDTDEALGPRWLPALFARNGADWHPDWDPATTAWGQTTDVDPCPARLQLPGVAGIPLRWVPYNGSAVPPPWAYETPERPRVCVTLGASGLRMTGRDPVPLAELLAALGDLDVEVVAAVTDDHVAELSSSLPANARIAAYVPLDVLLPSCAAIVHHGSPGTALAAAYHGVPQVALPTMPGQPFNAERIGRTGAGVRLDPATVTAEGLRAAVERVVHDPAPRDAAALLRAEILDQPAPSEVARSLSATTLSGRPAAVARE